MSADLQQGTDAWKLARVGCVTASRMADVMARTKSGYGASRANYQAELIVERLTGLPAERYVNAAMQFGTDNEPLARDAYSFHSDVDVAQAGFIVHPRIGMSGASPDGLVGEQGLVEIKAPNSATHIDTLLGAPIAQKYILQMNWQMACTQREWCDFVSFYPRLPEHMRLYVKRVQRDEKLIGELEREVALFLREVDTKLDALRGTLGVAA